MTGTCAVCESKLKAVDAEHRLCKVCRDSHVMCQDCDGEGVTHGRVRMGPGYSRPTTNSCRACDGRGFVPSTAQSA